MTTRLEPLEIGAGAPGIRYRVQAHHFGDPESGPRAYIQAGLHSDEFPGVMAAHHLIAKLETASAQRRILGNITVVPSANPISLNQAFGKPMLGRWNLDDLHNFNRNFPDLSEAAAKRIRGTLSWDLEENTRKVRAALKAALEALPEPVTPGTALRHTLLGLALDADYVIDLHCDEQAPVHMYTAASQWPDLEDLACQTGAEHVFLTQDTVSMPFDEACSRPWRRLEEMIDDARPLAIGCLAATLELRGVTDVSDQLGKHDADAIYRFLQRRGLIKGEPGELPELKCEPAPASGVAAVRSPASGIVVHQMKLGDVVYEGDLIADVIDPETQDRTPVFAVSDGIVWSRCVDCYVRHGDVVIKTTAPTPV